MYFCPIELHGPSTIVTHSAMTYTNFPCHKVEDAKTEILKNAKSGLQCGINKTCEINVEINGKFVFQKNLLYPQHSNS